MRHILELTSEFWDFAAELTELAEVIISSVVNLCFEELTFRYGKPTGEDGSAGKYSVVALGKCGGRELGFASDIELMFIYDGTGYTDGPEKIEISEFYEKLVRSVISSIHARQEGIFQIDLRLRPYGNAGSMAVSLEAFRRYFSPDGPAWAYERQALVNSDPSMVINSLVMKSADCVMTLSIATEYLMSQPCVQCGNDRFVTW
jgi:glutamate-ammonia-ligase adenylyltransferase